MPNFRTRRYKNKKNLFQSLNCLRFANPAEAIGGRHSEAWRLRCVEAQKLVDLGSFLDLLDGFWRTSKIFVL